MEVGGVSMEEPVSAGETFSHANASLDSKVCKTKVPQIHEHLYLVDIC